METVDCICGDTYCTIPYGTCHCGCEGKTNLAPQSRTARKWKRGEPKPYLLGHNSVGNQYRKKGPNEIRHETIDGLACIWIKLSRGKWTVILEDDYASLRGFRWWCTKNGYAFCSLPNGKNVGMHTMIVNAAAGLEPDHRNGDRLDNRRSNLRSATPTQNQQNRGIDKRNTSGCRGVCPAKRGRWRARIVVNGQEIALGEFREKEAAFAARIKAEQQYCGEFRRIS